MSVEDTTGVRALARILHGLADGQDHRVADFIEDESISRSTAFDVVRRLRLAGFVSPAPRGRIRAGSRLVALGYSRFGLTALHGPAEAIARWLRDHTAATVRLSCGGRDQPVTLAYFTGAKAKRGADSFTISLPVCRDDGGEAAVLDITPSHAPSRSEATEIDAMARRAKLTLESYLRGDSVDGHSDGRSGPKDAATADEPSIPPGRRSTTRNRALIAGSLRGGLK
jgi:hypothetical protein